jgi:hypothetical protein
MRRRSFLAATGIGVATGVAGCLDGEVVMEIQELVRIQGGEGWTQKIDEPSGSAEVGYTAKSEDDRFEVFYFTDKSEFMNYQEYISLDPENRDEDVRDLTNRPVGYETLSSIARHVETEGLFEASKPDEGRYSIEFDSTHYIALDYSNYGTLPLENKNTDIQITIDLEVVESRF